MWYVYVLRSLQDGNYYTGFTGDLRCRYGGVAPMSANLRSDITEWVRGL